MSEDRMSEVVGKVADLSVVKRRKQLQEADLKRDKEQNHDVSSVFINGNGVCYHLCVVINYSANYS